MKKLDDVEAVERERAMFECDVSDPEADVTWFKDEKVRHRKCFSLIYNSTNYQ